MKRSKLLCLTSNKPTKTLRIIYGENGMLGYIEDILGTEVGGGRRGQLKMLNEIGYSFGNMGLYDDAEKNLVIADELGLKAVFAAKLGIQEGFEDIENVKHRGKGNILSPAEVPLAAAIKFGLVA